MTQDRNVNISRSGNQWQQQNPFNQMWLPAIQAGLALVVVGLVAVDVAAFMWLVGPSIALVAFWLPAVYFAWKHNVNATGLCVTLALFAFMAIVLNWEFPPLLVNEWWWPWLRVVLAIIALALPPVAYLLFKRYTTDLRFENLLSSVMVQRGRELREGIVSDTIEPAQDEEGGDPFGYS